MPQTRELRVFISSTFRDLVEEREQLTKKVFPALRSLCRERGVEFTEIDLRWGLTDEEAHNGKIIRTCFEEIDACRPYFIGIIGSRYGWVPSFAEIQKDPLLVKRFPWVEDAALDGMSILEMEFNYAALRNPTAAENTFFYLRRDRHVGHRYIESVASGDAPQLQRLRESVRASGLPIREYSGAETLGEMIHDDLLAVIEKKWPQGEESALDRERFQHGAFATSRRHAYIANPERIRRLTKVIRNERRSVVVLAPSGGGKSALLAYWAHHILENDPNAFIIEHYIGNGNSGSDAASIALRIIREISDRCDLNDDIPAKPEECPAQLPFWLARINEPCTIILDAVNQLDEASRTLSWLPEQMPNTVQLVVSTTDAVLATTLSDRGFALEVLEPLTKNEREAIIVRYLNEYHKSLSLEQSILIAADEKCSSPLYLRTMLEELRIVGTHKQLDTLIERYLTASDTDALFQLVLERLEDDFGSRTVRELMSLIWASRNGLSQTELAELLAISQMKLSTILLALDYHLQRNAGLLTFFHEYLRRAVESRYMQKEDHKQHLHIAIAEYMSAQPLTDRYLTEEPWQWREAQKWNELGECLTRTERLSYYFTELRQYEFLSYWLALPQHIDHVSLADKAVEQLGRITDPETRATLIGGLGWIFYLATDYEQAERILRRAVDDCSSLGPDNSVSVDLTTKLAHSLQSLAKSEEAEALLATHIESLEKGMNASAHNLHTLRRVLAFLYYERGDFLKAASVMEEIIEAMDAISDPIEQPEMYSTYGAILQKLGKFDLAEINFTQAHKLRLKVYGEQHPVVAQDLNNLSMAQFRLNKLQQALDHISAAHAHLVRALGPKHIETLKIVMNQALIFQSLGDLHNAQLLFNSTYGALLEKFGKEDSLTLKCLANLAGVLRKIKKWDEAEIYEREIADLRTNLLGVRHPETINAYFNLGQTLAGNRKLEEARAFIQKALDLRLEVFGKDDGIYKHYIAKTDSIFS